MYVVIWWHIEAVSRKRLYSRNNTVVQTSSRYMCPLQCSKDVLEQSSEDETFVKPVYPNEATELQRSGLTSGSKASSNSNSNTGVDVDVVQYSR